MKRLLGLFWIVGSVMTTERKGGGFVAFLCQGFETIGVDGDLAKSVCGEFIGGEIEACLMIPVGCGFMKVVLIPILHG